jgi:hypothetical protein
VCEDILRRLNDLPDPLVRFAPSLTIEARVWNPSARAAFLDEHSPGISVDGMQAIKKEIGTIIPKSAQGNEAGLDVDLNEIKKNFAPAPTARRRES